MNGFADVIVLFLFFPVTVFIIIPLTMLCGWLVWRAVGMRNIKQPARGGTILHKKSWN